MTSLRQSRLWVAEGTALVLRAMANLDDGAGVVDGGALTAPTAVEGWSRAHILAHLAGNARGLHNLAIWASTGVTTPMYASPAQRTKDIEAGAATPPAQLMVDVVRTATELEEIWDTLTPQQWAAPVHTARGRVIPARETPWLRAREVMIHATDLDAGITFEDLPDSFCEALALEITTKRSDDLDSPAFIATPTDSDVILDTSATQSRRTRSDQDIWRVTGTLAQITAWLSGRRYTAVWLQNSPEFSPSADPHTTVIEPAHTLAPRLPAWL